MNQLPVDEQKRAFISAYQYLNSKVKKLEAEDKARRRAAECDIQVKERLAALTKSMVNLRSDLDYYRNKCTKFEAEEDKPRKSGSIRGQEPAL
jgi:hypothetical protein